MSHTYKIRQATPEDIAAIAHAGRDFFAESNWHGLQLSSERIYSSLAYMLSNENFVMVLAETAQGLPAGFSFWQLENPWTVELMALMVLFYVRPDHRNAQVANGLLDYSLQLCQDKGAKMFYSSSTAGFNDAGANERAFTALLKRRGFKTTGAFLCKGGQNV